MSRLTKKTELGDYIFIDGEKVCPNEIAIKLGILEDILEEYGVEDLTDLKIALDYYNHRFDGLHTERVDKNE